MSGYPKTPHHNEFGDEIKDEEALIEDEEELLSLDEEEPEEKDTI